MRIRYKLSILMILLTVVIIVLINFSYVRIVTWAADQFISGYLRHQVTNIFVDVPEESNIDWRDMQAQIDRAVQESSDLLYVAVYDIDSSRTRALSVDVERIRDLAGGVEDLRDPRRIMGKLSRQEIEIKDAREIEIITQSNPPSTSLRVVIGYMFPISGGIHRFIVWIALVLILVFTAIAVSGAFFLANGITRPIRKLASAMQEASEGNLDTSVRVRSRDEVGQLARDFNKMIYQLKENRAELEQLNRTLEERVQQGVAELRRRDEAERQRLMEEIQRAREVQMGLFPQSPPRIEGFDIWGICHPASEVGGDFFDYLHLGTDKSCLALGDVSGKGLKGAMNATMAYGMLHAQARRYSSAAAIISELNVALSARFEETTFTTLSLGILDAGTREMQLCNAGNPYPILLREGEASLLELSGMPLGIIPEIEYDETKLMLMPGDILIFYSDGISEATTQDERMYSMEALRELIMTFPANLDARAVVGRILQDVRSFVGDSPQSDDMTVIAVRTH